MTATVPESAEWKCQVCGEVHAPIFFDCWKCGHDRSGVPDPEFSIYDAANVDSAPPDSSDGKDRLKLQLPVFSYVALPFYLLVSGYSIYSMPFADPSTISQSITVTPTTAFDTDSLTKSFRLVATVTFTILIAVPLFIQWMKLFGGCSMTSIQRLNSNDWEQPSYQP